ncbi:DUF5719 family protein [Nocardioides salsibiostraticola]
MNEGRSGRRMTMRGRRPDGVAVVATVVPVVVALLLLMVAGRDGTDRFGLRDESTSPTAVPANSATLICPGGIDRTFLSSATEGGEVSVRDVGRQADRDADPTTRSVVAGAVNRLPKDRSAMVITGEGPVASGVVASRFTLPFAAAECRDPDPELWFTGVGAGARYSSTLELVNPDAGPAVVSIAVYGRRGEVSAPQLRGVAVPARGTITFDLARTLPRRDELALRVVASRGRVRASVSGQLDRLDGGTPSVDWLPGQVTPATTNRLLGADTGSGQRTLVLANPGDAQVRATIRLITTDSVFAPVGSEPVVVAPGSTTRVDAAPLLRAANAQGVIGFEVQSSQPITAALRSLVSDDLVFVAPGDPVTTTTALVVPTGAKRLLLAGATGPGTVVVTSTDADGKNEREKEVEVVRGRGYSVSLPDSASLVRITPQATLVEASILRSDAGRSASRGQGTVVFRMRDLLRQSLVPGVRPGAPS